MLEITKYLYNKIFKPNGISVLISAQNEEKTIRTCVESFLDFCDEIIIVTNGSTDSTRTICDELAFEHEKKVRFFDQPDLRDLSMNRSFALSNAKYKWVMRCDADYIAYQAEDGKYSINALRNRVMQTRAFFPTQFYLEQVNISYKLTLTRATRLPTDIPNKIPTTFSEGYMPRIYLNTFLLSFVRRGSNETVAFNSLSKRIFISNPYWFHVTLNDDRDLFLRSARREWRAMSDTYKDIMEYIQAVHIPEYYPGKSFDEAVNKYIETVIKPQLTDYIEDEFYPYPKSLKRLINEQL